MINNIIKYIRQNRWKVISTIVLIIFIYSLIKLADNAYINQNSNNTVVKYELNKDASINITSSKSEKTINEFLGACQNENYEQAYNYLSNDCKTKQYPSVEEFKNNYCLKNKIKSKSYNIKVEGSVSRYTYKIEFNNSLSTGKKTSSTNSDYYTIIIDKNNEYKIDINGYLPDKGM